MNLDLQGYDEIISEIRGNGESKEEVLFNLRKRLTEIKNMKEIALAIILPIQIFTWSLMSWGDWAFLFYIVMFLSAVIMCVTIKLSNKCIFNLEIKIDFIEKAEEI